MDAPYYSLILTRSSHVINRDAACEVRRALEAGERTVEIDLTLFQSEVRRTVLNTAHIIAIAEDQSRSEPERVAGGANVRALRSRNAV